MRNRKTFLASILFMLLLCGCGKSTDTPGMTTTTARATTTPIITTEATVQVQSIVLSAGSCEITVDETYQIAYVIMPENATNPAVTWKTVDDSIAKVDENGLVTGLAAGQTSIIVSAGNDVFSTLSVTVKEKPAYERLSERDRELTDVFFRCVGQFKNPSSVSITFAYYNKVTDSWSISVRAQNSMGGYTEEDYDLDRNGKITKPIFDHIKTGLDGRYNLELINEAIADYTKN